MPKFPGVTSAACNASAVVALTGVSVQDNHRYVGATVDGMSSGGGMWFSTPEVGECPFDAPFGSSGLTGSSGQGCVWRMRPVVRVLWLKDLVAAGWNATASAPGNIQAFGAAWSALDKAFNRTC
jgi:hypothetical protein